ncbi:hypothetical protein HJD18_10460 [Thermoleophilia bacterium SCSIO 60948]|nr:hypothetical protein HJD18_10460 [Thermoleophilia bacterium SCSIO 60948]
MAERTPEPAPRGNRLAVSHGAYAKVAPEREDAKAREIFDALAADAPVRDADGGLPAADGAAVSLLAQTLVRLDDLRAYIDQNGLTARRYRSTDPQKKRQRKRAPRTTASVDPLRLIALEDRLVGRAEGLLDKLGMTPTSRARLGLDQARSMDLAREWEQRDQAARREDAIEAEASDA